MGEAEFRSRNRRTALVILAGMVAMGVIAAVFVLATQSYRREVDFVKPDSPSFARGLIVTSTAGAVIAMIGTAVYLRFKSRR
jgi:hypothetical protein